jgi:hypothetical protein
MFNDPRALPCQHVYCKDCLQQHIVASLDRGWIRCPLCNENVRVPRDGVDGYPMGFHHINLMEIYDKMLQTNPGSKAAQLRHNSIVKKSRTQLQDEKASKEQYLQEIKEAITKGTQQKDKSIQKVRQQERQLIIEFTKQVRDHRKTIIGDILLHWSNANEELLALKETVEAEKEQLEECIENIKSCLKHESEATAKTSLEDVTNFKHLLKDMSPHKPVQHFTVRVDCPHLNIYQRQVALVKFSPSDMLVDLPTNTSITKPDRRKDELNDGRFDSHTRAATARTSRAKLQGSSRLSQTYDQHQANVYNYNPRGCQQQ